ncbi:MAG: pilus assembly protein TadG-related protein [Devosia sp.]|uniref:pilus assembly protein TadG-related protein n=1 Tax=Devosia sp. TaxID=1871048 RepID=UPI00339B7C5B
MLKDQQGNVAVISALMLLPMLVLAGGATDIARYEAFRAQLQDGVDRAVLASASLTQRSSIESTAAEYLKSVTFIDDVTLDIDYETALNSRAVTITARYEMATGFLPLIGIDSMPIVAVASAAERRPNLEISLMLDISGSMLDDSPSRISLLRPAAKQFVDAMITEDTAPYTSLSIVPYAGTVNPGALAFGLLGVTRQHNYSSCIEFDHTSNVDYGTGMVPFNLRAQVPHFTHNHASNPGGKEWSYCPYEATSITYLSNNATALKARIDSLKLHDGTGTGVATNWGYLLLDPSAQPFVSRMAAAGQVPMQFSNRPAAFNDSDTLKVLVLMTDGNISNQERPKQYAFPRAQEGGPSLKTPPYQYGSSNNTALKPTASVSLRRVCQIAKENGVIIFTIGFYTTSADLTTCASSANHFYNVKGNGITLAFQSIANSIQNLKLTQ